MKKPIALVTGAAGFVGRYVVKKLDEQGFMVRAGVHSGADRTLFEHFQRVEVITVNILDCQSLMNAMKGVDSVYHFAALVDAHKTREELTLVNVEGTRNVWTCAAESGVTKSLYCSSAAVYGLLAQSDKQITEEIPARAVESYGNTKYLGERAALEIAAHSGLHTIVIRPVAIFGPGEHTAFGKALRAAAVSKLLIAGGFQNKKFNFVHVEDVAGAAIYLMQKEIPSGQVFNVAVNEPIAFEEAFRAYIRVLRRAGNSFIKIRVLALISVMLHRVPLIIRWCAKVLGERFVFKIWHPGFDLNYSSAKLLDTSFVFKWTDFEGVFYSCVGKDPS